MKHFPQTLAGLLLASLVSLQSADSLAAQKLAEFQRIVIADDANPVQRAAAELTNYAKQICGQKIEVLALCKFASDAPGFSFIVGDGAAEVVLASPMPWKTEEWMLRTVPRNLVLAGDDGVGDPWSISTAAGTMLAVYTLLEDHLGARWFWPGEFGEHVPVNVDAMLPALDERRQPSFEIRSV